MLGVQHLCEVHDFGVKHLKMLYAGLTQNNLWTKLWHFWGRTKVGFEGLGKTFWNFNCFSVPYNKELVDRTVPSNKELVDGTVPSNKKLLDGTVPYNITILYTIHFIYSPYTYIVYINYIV